MATVPINLFTYLDDSQTTISTGEINSNLIFRCANNGFKNRVYSTGGGIIFNYQGTEDAEGGYFNSLQNAIDFHTPLAWDQIMGGYFTPNSGVIDDYVQGEVIYVDSPAYEAIIEKADKTITINGHALSSNVTVSKSDVGLGNVNDTADADKPVSTATQTALDGKHNTITPMTIVSDATNATDVITQLNAVIAGLKAQGLMEA